MMSKCDYTKLKREDLLKLPVKPFSKIKTYDCLLIVPTRRKHDSGWRLMYIIGCDKTGPIEIASYCDDIHFILPNQCEPYIRRYCNDLRCDMTLSNCARLWSNVFQFKIGDACSTTDVELVSTTDVELVKINKTE